MASIGNPDSENGYFSLDEGPLLKGILIGDLISFEGLQRLKELADEVLNFPIKPIRGGTKDGIRHLFVLKYPIDKGIEGTLKSTAFPGSVKNRGNIGD